MSSDKVKIFSRNENVERGPVFVSLRPMDSSPTTAQAAEPLQPRSVLWLGLKPSELVTMLVASLLVLAASYCGWIARWRTYPPRDAHMVRTGACGSSRAMEIIAWTAGGASARRATIDRESIPKFRVAAQPLTI